MTMPIDLVLVRHGESEGNVANRMSRAGDHSAFTPEFLSRHSSLWRLSDRGREQAGAAKKCIQEIIGSQFDRHYCSEYIRAMETATLLELPKASWFLEFYLRERDWGRMDNMSQEERRRRYSDDLRLREIDNFFWSPPNGESMAQVCLRIDRVWHTLHRECSDMRVIMICHADLMWGFRVRLERMPQSRYRILDESKDPKDHIHNCHILHYTRRDPATGFLHPHLDWLRSICPWDITLSSNLWEHIERKKYANEELAQEVAKHHRMING